MRLHSATHGLPALAGSAGFTPSDFRAADGRLWFSTAKGLAIVNPKQAVMNRLPPPVVIEDILISDKHPVLAKPWDETTLVRIPPGSQQLEIQFTALSYTAPEKVRFRWILEGLDPSWSEPSTQRSVTYSYLRPGRYQFRVIACNNDAVWNERPAVLKMVMLPFFWETWWFKVGITLLGLAGFGTAIVMAQRGRLRRKLERVAREQEIERERARIAQDIHDDLGSSLTRIGMLSQTASEHPQDAAQTNRYLDQIYATASVPVTGWSTSSRGWSGSPVGAALPTLQARDCAWNCGCRWTPRTGIPSHARPRMNPDVGCACHEKTGWRAPPVNG